MKKLTALILVICLVGVVFVACRARTDRAENNGIVTDDTSRRTETTDRTTTNRDNGKDTSDKKKDDTTDRDSDDTKTTDTKDGMLNDAGDAVSDAVKGATDAVDDILGGGKDTRN